MRILVSVIVLSILSSACFRNKMETLSKKEIKEKRMQDSLAELEAARLRLAELEKIRLDSIRVADSIAALPPPVNYDTVLIASLQRTPCLGKCPHYEIRLYYSGYAEYIGFANVEKIGKFDYRFDTVFIRDFLKNAELFDYFSFADFYPQSGKQISDFPMCVSSLRSENELKIIYNRNDAPIQLIRYQNYFDSLFAETDWKPVGSEAESKAGKGLLQENR